MRARPAPNEPEIALVDWRILQSEHGKQHFVGIRAETGKGYVSTAITNLDLNTMIGATSTGRKYRLVGLPARNDEWVRTWAEWCALFCQPPPIDMTAETLHLRSHTDSASRVNDCDGADHANMADTTRV